MFSDRYLDIFRLDEGTTKHTADSSISVIFTMETFKSVSQSETRVNEKNNTIVEKVRKTKWTCAMLEYLRTSILEPAPTKNVFMSRI